MEQTAVTKSKDWNESEPATTKEADPDDYKLLRYGMIDLHGLACHKAQEKIPRYVKLDDAMLGIVCLVSLRVDRKNYWRADLDHSGYIRKYRESVGPAPLVKHGEKYYY